MPAEPVEQTEAPSLKSPYKDEAQYTMNRINYLALGQLEFIPLSGKIALLSSLFSYFDFYVLGGAGVVNLVSIGAPAPSCPVFPDHPCHTPGTVFTATQLAITGGLGAHAFVARWMAINLELRDLIYKNNASGRDVNGDSVTDSYDLEWTNNWVFSLNFQFFFPTKAKISR